MIIRVTFENYRSFKDVETLDFVSNSHIPFDNKHRYEFGRLHLLKNVGIFGANASGKTTVISAIGAMRSFILKGKIDNNIAFKGQEDKPTKFSIVFENDSKFYEYSFSIKFNKQTNYVDVLDETLYELTLSGSSTLIYSKKDGINKPDNIDFETFERGYKNTMGQLFLTYMVAPERVIMGSSISECFVSVYTFFARKISIVLHETDLLFSICEQSIDMIKDKLHEYDTGIESVSFAKLSETELASLKSDEFVQKSIIIPLLRESRNNFDSYFCDGDDIYMFKKEKGAVIIKKLLFSHVNIKDKFSYKDESDGTRVIFSLIAELLCSDNSDNTLFIDEIERSSHPVVVKQLIRDFQKHNAGNKSQLVFTSHLNVLMDQVLQRDEVFFVEKDDYGKSIIKSLQEYKSWNRREAISKKYLEGRYGALPNIGIEV